MSTLERKACAGDADSGTTFTPFARRNSGRGRGHRLKADASQGRPGCSVRTVFWSLFLFKCTDIKISDLVDKYKCSASLEKSEDLGPHSFRVIISQRRAELPTCRDLASVPNLFGTRDRIRGRQFFHGGLGGEEGWSRR